MKFLTCSFLMAVALLLLSGCAVTHKFGPYTGKVVDKDTGEPIAGAVVFLRFSTGTIWSPGGRVSHFADAVEYLTDSKGEFKIPAQRIFTFHPGDTWNQMPRVIIFKPGYGAYPGHPDTLDGNTPSGWLHAGRENNIRLPPLRTKGERADNLDNTFVHPSVPYKKMKELFALKNTESLAVGLTPWPIPSDEE